MSCPNPDYHTSLSMVKSKTPFSFVGTKATEETRTELTENGTHSYKVRTFETNNQEDVWNIVSRITGATIIMYEGTAVNIIGYSDTLSFFNSMMVFHSIGFWFLNPLEWILLPIFYLCNFVIVRLKYFTIINKSSLSARILWGLLISPLLLLPVATGHSVFIGLATTLLVNCFGFPCVRNKKHAIFPDSFDVTSLLQATEVVMVQKVDPAAENGNESDYSKSTVAAGATEYTTVHGGEYSKDTAQVQPSSLTYGSSYGRALDEEKGPHKL